MCFDEVGVVGLVFSFYNVFFMFWWVLEGDFKDMSWFVRYDCSFEFHIF